MAAATYHSWAALRVALDERRRVKVAIRMYGPHCGVPRLLVGAVGGRQGGLPAGHRDASARDGSWENLSHDGGASRRYPCPSVRRLPRHRGGRQELGRLEPLAFLASGLHLRRTACVGLVRRQESAPSHWQSPRCSR